MAGLSLLHFTSPEDHLENFCEKVVCQSVSDNEQKTLVLLLKNFRPEDHTSFCVSQGKFCGTTVFQKEIIFFSSSDIEWNIFRILSKLFRRACKNCNSFVQRNNLRKITSLKKVCTFLFIFGKSVKKFRPCGTVFPMGFQGEHATYTKKTFWSNFSLECFRKLPSLSRRDIFRPLANKYFYRFVINAPYLSTSPFGWLLSSLGKRPLFLNQFRTSISEIVSGLLPTNFQLDFSELRSTFTEDHS